MSPAAAATRLAYRWKKNPGEASGHTLLMGDDGEYRFQVDRNVGPAAGGVHGDYLYIDQPKHLAHEGPAFTQAPNRAELVESLEALIANGRAEWAREDRAAADASPAEHAADADLGLVAALLNGDEQVTQLYHIITTKDPQHVEAWLRMVEAVAGGEDFAVAEARFKQEIAQIGPDAALIQACEDYPARVAEDNAAPDDEADDGPAWQRYSACRDIISEAQPATLAGMLAKARTAIFDARGPRGDESVEGSMGQVWAWDLTKDIVRLLGNTPPSGASDAELIAHLDEARRLLRSPSDLPAFPTLADIMAPKRWSAPMHAAASLPARTQEGIRAKAELVADWLAGGDRTTGPGCDCDREMAVAWSLLRDILGPDVLAPVPPPRKTWTEERGAEVRASMPPPVELPNTPDKPWLFSNALRAIETLAVQGWRLATACVLAAHRAEGAGDRTRAYNLLLAGSAAAHQQANGLGLDIAYNTDLAPRPAPLVPGTPEHRAHAALKVTTYRGAVRWNLRKLREAQAEHGAPLPPDDGTVLVQHDEGTRS